MKIVLSVVQISIRLDLLLIRHPLSVFKESEILLGH